MRLFLLSFLFFVSLLSYAQQEKFKLLGAEYVYHYLPELNEFKICKITDTTPTVCKRYKIPTTDYLLVDLLEKNKEYFNESNPYFFDKTDSLKLDSLYDSVKDCWSKHPTNTFEKLSDLEIKLPPNFVRTHRSYITNRNFVRQIQPQFLVLMDGTEIPISRNLQKEWT